MPLKPDGISLIYLVEKQQYELHYLAIMTITNKGFDSNM